MKLILLIKFTVGDAYKWPKYIFIFHVRSAAPAGKTGLAGKTLNITSGVPDGDLVRLKRQPPS